MLSVLILSHPIFHIAVALKQQQCNEGGTLTRKLWLLSTPLVGSTSARGWWGPKGARKSWWELAQQEAVAGEGGEGNAKRVGGEGVEALVAGCLASNGEWLFLCAPSSPSWLVAGLGARVGGWWATAGSWTRRWPTPRTRRTWTSSSNLRQQGYIHTEGEGWDT